MNIEIDAENFIVKSDLGGIDFVIDEDSISIFQIYVSKERCGVGSSLVKKLEEFALKNRLKNITVPVTPSKKALSFWLKMGYTIVFEEDVVLVNRILNSRNPEKIVNTNSGIILLTKNIQKEA